MESLPLPSARGRPRACALKTVAAVLLGALPTLSGCVAGGLDPSQVPTGRVCFPEPPIRLRLHVAGPFVDGTGEAPALLGELLAKGVAGMARRSRIFAAVTGPETPGPDDRGVRRGSAPGAAPSPARLRAVRLEGRVVSFAYFQDYRWLGLYGFIMALPIVGVSAVALGIFLLGVPVYSDRGQITVELRLRDETTGTLLGTYRGEADATFHHGLYSFDTFTLSFWQHPETLFGLALRRALQQLVEDRAVYRRLAEGAAAPPAPVTSRRRPPR